MTVNTLRSARLLCAIRSRRRACAIARKVRRHRLCKPSQQRNWAAPGVSRRDIPTPSFVLLPRLGGDRPSLTARRKITQFPGNNSQTCLTPDLVFVPLADARDFRQYRENLFYLEIISQITRVGDGTVEKRSGERAIMRGSRADDAQST